MIARSWGRRALQCSVLLGALVPIMAGAAGVFVGPGITGDVALAAVSLDSHFRYLSGLLLGVGLCFASFVPRIEKRNPSFQILAFIVFIGGLGRLYALLTVGTPNLGMLFGLGMELLVTPSLAVGQYVLSRRDPHTDYPPA